MELTGIFQRQSSQGNQCFLVGYHYDANHALGTPIKNRKGIAITEAWQKMHGVFKKTGAAPNTCVFDKDTSPELMEAFKEDEIQYQLVPPCEDRNNLA